MAFRSYHRFKILAVEKVFALVFDEGISARDPPALDAHERGAAPLGVRNQLLALAISIRRNARKVFSANAQRGCSGIDSALANVCFGSMADFGLGDTRVR